MLLYISLSERGSSRVTDLRQCVIFSVLEVGKEDEIQILSKMANPTQRQAMAIYLKKFLNPFCFACTSGTKLNEYS